MHAAIRNRVLHFAASCIKPAILSFCSIWISEEALKRKFINFRPIEYPTMYLLIFSFLSLYLIILIFLDHHIFKTIMNLFLFSQSYYPINPYQPN